MMHEVKDPGRYILIAQYYNPQSSSTTLNVTLTNEKTTPATLTAHHCSAMYGCRSIITMNKDGAHSLHIGQQIDIHVQGGNGTQPVYLVRSIV
jgi:hypothetical protein